MQDALQITIQRGMQNAKMCARNTRDLNRTQMMNETYRHQKKYSDPLIRHKSALAEDIEIIASTNKIKQSYLDDIFNNWQKINIDITSFLNIEKDLREIKITED